MDDSPILLLRMLERLLVAGFGGMSIYLGYRLFFHLPYEPNHEGKLELVGIKVVLSRVGPGIFFLAFGAFVLIQNIVNGIETEVKTNGNGLAAEAPSTTHKFVGATSLSGDNDNGLVQRRIAAIEKVGELNCLLKMLAANGAKVPTTMQIAHHDAKIALLSPVWNKQDWGDIDTLTNSNLITNENLSGILTDVSVACQH